MPSISLDILQRRADLMRQVRHFFDARSFIEVSTPVLAPEIIVDQHIDPLETRLYADPRKPDDGSLWYLRTSPEAHMKRLIAKGAQAIYQIGPVFRAGEKGLLHNPEFTMLEWYRVGDDMWAAIEFTKELWSTLGPSGCGDCQVVSYRDLFVDEVQLDPINASTGLIRNVAMARGAPVSGSRDDCLDFLLSEFLTPRISEKQAVILYGFPASQAALARLSPEDPTIASRFELYFGGIELANGYDELQCGDELARRFDTQNAERQKTGKPLLRGDSKLLNATKLSFPPCSGVALGFDRLLLLVTNEKKLDNVIPFDLAEA